MVHSALPRLHSTSADVESVKTILCTKWVLKIKILTRWHYKLLKKFSQLVIYLKQKHP